MKLVLITTFIIISECKRIREITPLITDCTVLLPVVNQSHTIFCDCDPDTYDLKLCLLKNSKSQQTVQIISLYKRDKSLNINTEAIKFTKIPNVIVLLKSLTAKSIDRFSVQTRFSHRTLVYIVVTSNDEFICENGSMKKQDLERLDSIMNKYWHKFKIMRVGIAFPNSCKHKMAIFSGKRATNQTLYDRSIKLIDATDPRSIFDAIANSGKKLTEHYPLRATMFYRKPTSIRNCKKIHYYRRDYNISLSGGFCGLDGMMMHDIVNYFKFNISFPNPDKCFDFGYVEDNNSTAASGSLGCIIRNETDVSFNGRFMTKYLDENVFFLHFVATDALCVLIKKTDVIPLWQATYNVYGPFLWLLILTVLVILGVVMWVAAVLSHKLTREQYKPLVFYIYDAVKSTLFGYSLQKGGKFRILRGTSLIGAILFGCIYQSHINQMHTTLRRFKSIKTLDQLYRSGITLYTSASMVNFINVPALLNPENSVQMEFYNKIRITENNRFSILLQTPHAATLERQLDVTTLLHNGYVDQNGKALIDVVDECLGFYYLAYITSADFPFYEEMTVLIQRLREAGFPNLYYKWTQQMLNIPKTQKLRPHAESRPYTKINLGDLRVAFGIMFVGHIASIIVFVAEIWRAKKKGQNLKFKMCCAKL